jgi:hypothetical protein
MELLHGDDDESISFCLVALLTFLLLVLCFVMAFLIVLIFVEHHICTRSRVEGVISPVLVWNIAGYTNSFLWKVHKSIEHRFIPEYDGSIKHSPDPYDDEGSGFY